jgi:hypothetical protein
MTKKQQLCSNCENIIKGNLILNCACGKQFCNMECLRDFHVDTDKKETRKPRRRRIKR